MSDGIETWLALERLPNRGNLSRALAETARRQRIKAKQCGDWDLIREGTAVSKREYLARAKALETAAASLRAWDAKTGPADG